jgi:hypothetical protein
MEKARTIELCFRRRDEGRDWKTLENCTLGQARSLVRSALQSAGGLYTEADICIERVYTETIPRAEAEVEFASVSHSSELPALGEQFFKVQIRVLA